MVRGSNTGGEEFSAPVQTGPGFHPASYTMGKVKEKVKFTLEQATKIHRGSRGIALLFL
jgi:hypothetical protein